MTGSLFLFASEKIAGRTEAGRAGLDLVEKVCSGDQAAFGEFYRVFAPMVHGILLSKLPFNDAEDAVQEVFLSAFKNLHSLRDKNAVGAWLAMIARNRAADFYRSSKPTEELNEDLPGKSDYRSEADEILQAIRSLPETYSETLALRLVEGMTGPEIAEKTNLTPDSVRVNLYRGMKLLREKLGIAESK
ncbi:MAG: sigma-70 family RNA polymerase sigma factor [Pyrinomonadaceae bacterium]|nr:sigma-70 family RNA polymerase sigma factor [Pyrinomonadaceae bacterium]